MSKKVNEIANRSTVMRWNKFYEKISVYKKQLRNFFINYQIYNIYLGIRFKYRNLLWLYIG